MVALNEVDTSLRGLDWGRRDINARRVMSSTMPNIIRASRGETFCYLIQEKRSKASISLYRPNDLLCGSALDHIRDTKMQRRFYGRLIGL